MKKKLTAVALVVCMLAFVPVHATKGPSVWKMGKQFCSGTITATVLGIVCPPVRQGQSPLWNGKQMPMTMQPS